MSTYQTIALPAIHKPIHNIDDLEPEIQHAIPLGQEHEVLQEDLAEQRGGLDAGLAHAVAVRREDLGLEQLQDQREQDLAEDGRPLLMVAARQLRRQQRPLQRRERQVPHLAARVRALRRERLEYREPVG